MEEFDAPMVKPNDIKEAEGKAARNAKQYQLGRRRRPRRRRNQRTHGGSHRTGGGIPIRIRTPSAPCPYRSTTSTRIRCLG